MLPATRSQKDFGDVESDGYSSDAMTDCSHKAERIDPLEQPGMDLDLNNDTARQEFAKDNKPGDILKKFGVPQLTKTPLFGDINFDTTLQEALETVRHADTLYSRLPKELKEKYPTRQHLYEGLFNGQFEADVEAANNPPEPEPAPAPVA